MAPGGLVLRPERLQEQLVRQRVALRDVQVDARPNPAVNRAAGTLVEEVHSYRTLASGKPRVPLPGPRGIVLGYFLHSQCPRVNRQATQPPRPAFVIYR